MIDSIPVPVRTIVLLSASNVFMTIAWYGHLKYLDQRPWIVAALLVITLLVFAPFAVFVMKEPLKLDFLWAGLCIVGAVCFIFRSR